MLRVPLALAAASAAFVAAPAVAAPPNLAAWTGTASVAACGASTCLTATSDFCLAAGADGAPVPCSVTLTGSWPGACTGVGSGQLVLTDSHGDTHWTNATLVAADGAVTFVARYAFLFDRTALVATGAVAGGCAGGVWTGAFGGRGL
jgi:hypothetical protein